MFFHLKIETPLATESKLLSVLPTESLGSWYNLEDQMQEVNFTYHLPLPKQHSPRTTLLEHSRSQLAVGRAVAQSLNRFYQAHADLAQIVSFWSWILHGMESSSVIITRSIKQLLPLLPLFLLGSRQPEVHRLTMTSRLMAVSCLYIPWPEPAAVPAHLMLNMVWKLLSTLTE